MTLSDFNEFWPTFSEVIKAQETYALNPDMTREQAFSLWCEAPLKSFALVENNNVLGTYYIKQNAMGPGDHICNCGYMVASEARGKGVAHSLCEHSMEMATELGFDAMQFNNVVSTNKVAVRLWNKFGFKTLGTVPKAFRHARLGLVDCYIMFKWLRIK